MIFNKTASIDSNCFVTDIIGIFGLQHQFKLSRQANLRFIIPFATTKPNLSCNTIYTQVNKLQNHQNLIVCHPRHIKFLLQIIRLLCTLDYRVYYIVFVLYGKFTTHIKHPFLILYGFANPFSRDKKKNIETQA